MDLLKAFPMLAFLLSYTILCLAFHFFLPISLASVAEPFHSACLYQIPVSGFKSYYAAIVCGQNLKPSDFKDALKVSGLLHLIVVSGSHLAFLEACFTRWSERMPKLHAVLRPLALPVLILFTLANSFQPPVTRALAALCLRNFNRHFHLNWSRLRTFTLAGLLTIFVCSTSQQFLSLIMSWIASLALNGFPRAKSYWQHLLVYILLIPALLPLSVPHPVSIFANATLGPILGSVLFPLSLASWLVHQLTPISDFGWRFFSALLESLPRFSGMARIEIPIALLAGYLVLLTVTFDRLEK